MLDLHTQTHTQVSLVYTTNACMHAQTHTGKFSIYYKCMHAERP